MSALTEFLLCNRKNRGVMATLRCALVENKEMRAWPLLARFGGVGSGLPARAVRTVAGLFAYHPENCDSGNMGTVCRSLCSSDEQPGKMVDERGNAAQPGPMGRRFMYLLNADRDEICERVTRLVLYAKSKGVPINYAVLEQDLTRWDGSVRERWAKEFWTSSPEQEDA